MNSSGSHGHKERVTATVKSEWTKTPTLNVVGLWEEHEKKQTHTLWKDGKNKSPNLSAVPHRAGHLVTNCSQLRIKSEAQAKQPWWILQYTAQQYCDNAFIIFFIVIHCVSPEIIPHTQVTEQLTSSTAWNKPFTPTFTPTANLEGTSNLIFFFFLDYGWKLKKESCPFI